MSLCSSASAVILVSAAVAFGQTAGWEEQRRMVAQMRQKGQLPEALDIARKMVSDAERQQPGAAPLPLALHDYGVVSGDLSLYADAERALRRAIRLLEIAPPRDHSVVLVFHLRLAEIYLDAGRLRRPRSCSSSSAGRGNRPSLDRWSLPWSSTISPGSN